MYICKNVKKKEMCFMDISFFVDRYMMTWLNRTNQETSILNNSKLLFTLTQLIPNKAFSVHFVKTQNCSEFRELCTLQYTRLYKNCIKLYKNLNAPMMFIQLRLSEVD